jgi:phytanoyl-CoA hydroxylase
MQPTPEQVEAYRRDGFLVVQEFLDADEVGRLREHFAACFEHEWETGLQPDEVNYVPGRTPPDLTRQLCNAWKADRTVAATVLSQRNAEFGAALAGVAGLRLAQDNLIWKPPSGKALLCHQDAAYLDHLDPPNMTTCWMALDDTSDDTGTIFYVRGSNHWPHARLGGDFHAPDDWLAHVRASSRRTPSWTSCRSRSRPAAWPSTTAGRSTAARPTSAPTPSAGRWSAT